MELTPEQVAAVLERVATARPVAEQLVWEDRKLTPATRRKLEDHVACQLAAWAALGVEDGVALRAARLALKLHRDTRAVLHSAFGAAGRVVAAEALGLPSPLPDPKETGSPVSRHDVNCLAQGMTYVGNRTWRA